MAVATLKYITAAEYLALEEKSETKHEYYAGQIYAMAGGTEDHSLIAANAGGEIRQAAKGTSCRVYQSDLRVRVDATGLNTYPDVAVVCGKSVRTSDSTPAVTNPAVLVEVLSESTQYYDRGEKWWHYQQISSLRDYLLVWQDRPRVEQYTRQGRGIWTYLLVEGLDGSIALEGIGEIPLAELYRGVEFSAPARTLHPNSNEEQNGNS
jgi:Uma2 family endonuclease